MTDGIAGRRLGRIMLWGTAFVIFVLQPLLFVAAPGAIGSMFEQMVGPLTTTEAVTLVGIVGQMVGFVWMVRLYRSHLEGEHRFWRYRLR
jgi:hypothetical protein